MEPARADAGALWDRLGKAIRAARGSMTQAELADVMAIDQSRLSGYESGKVHPPLDVVIAIERALNARAGTIFGLAGLIDEDTEAVIRRDPRLTEFGRRTVAGFYLYTRDEFDEGPDL